MKDMDRWLGDGGMAVIGAIGASIDAYGVTDAGTGWCRGGWSPTALACNPHGIVQAGVHAILLDAAMNFAINSGMAGRDRTKATLEMKAEYLRAARGGDALVLEGNVVRETKQVAFAEARVLAADGSIVSKSTGTFLLHRDG